MKPTVLNTISSMFISPLEIDQLSFVETVVMPSIYPYYEWDGHVYNSVTMQDTGVKWNELFAVNAGGFIDIRV